MVVYVSRYQPNDRPHARASCRGDYGAGWGELGSRVQSSSSEPHRTGAAWHRLRTRSQTRVQTAPSAHQMVGGIKAISPCVKSASPKLFLDLHTVSAPSGEERTLDAAAQVERAALCFRRSDSGTHAWCGHATVMVLVSSASGPRVSGCICACRY